MSTIDKKVESPLPPSAIRQTVGNSSQIKEVAYVPATKIMYVNFLSNDSVYSYSPVEERKFQAMIDSPSVGAYFYKHFKRSDALKVKSL